MVVNQSSALGREQDMFDGLMKRLAKEIRDDPGVLRGVGWGGRNPKWTNCSKYR